MNGFLNRLKSRGRPDAERVEPRLLLAAFGKHPGWDDHMPGIGLETEALAHVKHTLYVGGIGRQIDSGAWERLEPEKRLEGFDHVFLWRRGNQLLLGRIWSSTDRKGRAKYPMILCVEAQGVSPQFLLDKAGPELERLRAACQTVTTAGEVTAACQASQERLRLPANFEEPTADPATIAAQRRRFLEHPEIGPDRLSLLRVLHELRMTSTGDSGSPVAPSHLRVPEAAGATAEALALWLAFFQAATPKGAPVFVTHRKNTNWLDVIIGEPQGDHFFCLGASLGALPLTTQIPYDLAPELNARLKLVESRFLGEEPATQVIPPNPPKASPAAAPPPPSPVITARPATAAAPKPPVVPPATGKSPNKFIFVAFGVVLLAVIVGVLLRSGHGNSKPADATSASPAPSVSAPATPPNGENYDAALADARAALDRKDYATAISRADAALNLKPADAAAAGLKADAQAKLDQQGKLDAQYQAALQSGQTAYDQHDYQAALTAAATALSLRPADPAALQLQTESKSQLDLSQIATGQQRQKYDAAMAAAKAALDQRDFATAITQAENALAITPNDAAAAQLKATAESLRDAAIMDARQTQQYDAAMAAARTAFDQQDYPTAAAKADAALGARSNDAAAALLKSNALAAQAAIQTKAAQAAEFTNLVSAAQAALDARDYATAIQRSEAALAIRPADPSAIDLRKKAVDSKDLADATLLFHQGQFQQAEDLCQAHAGTPEFEDLAGKMKILVAKTYDPDLEVYLVRFGLLDPNQASTPEARKETRLIEDLYDQRDLYLNRVNAIKKAFQAVGGLDAARQKQIDGLIKAINEHS